MFICEIWLFGWCFPHSANLISRSADISKCFRGPFDFELKRVDCTYLYTRLPAIKTMANTVPRVIATMA